jgi:hypothetical protein
MRWIAVAALALNCAACGVAPQPESSETVAAFEIPLPTESERAEFLALVSEVAEAEGLHVDAATPDELRQTANAIPEAEMTIHAAVWRGTEDNDSEAAIMDQADHLGGVWIMFSKGEAPALARRFRDRAMNKITQRWPTTLSLPIMPNGAIPLSDDLVRTPTGYEVKPSAAAKYAASDL